MTDPDPGPLLASMPFSATIGMAIDAASRDEVRGHLEWSADRCTIGGALHGGVLMALADSLGAVCAFLNLPEGAAGTSTIESKTNFFRGVREADGPVSATSVPLHAGRTTIVVQTDLRNAAGKRVALVTQTQAVISG
jgi:uncharacterized protein (TIGR00369 family)